MTLKYLLDELSDYIDVCDHLIEIAESIYDYVDISLNAMRLKAIKSLIKKAKKH